MNPQTDDTQTDPAMQACFAETYKLVRAACDDVIVAQAEKYPEDFALPILFGCKLACAEQIDNVTNAAVQIFEEEQKAAEPLVVVA